MVKIISLGSSESTDLMTCCIGRRILQPKTKRDLSSSYKHEQSIISDCTCIYPAQRVSPVLCRVPVLHTRRSQDAAYNMAGKNCIQPPILKIKHFRNPAASKFFVSCENHKHFVSQVSSRNISCTVGLSRSHERLL